MSIASSSGWRSRNNGTASRAERSVLGSTGGRVWLTTTDPNASALSATTPRWSWRPSGDRKHRRLGGGGTHAHPCRDEPGDRIERDRGRSRLPLRDGRHADVAALPDRDVQRDLAQELQAVLLREPLPA